MLGEIVVLKFNKPRNKKKKVVVVVLAFMEENSPEVPVVLI